MTAPQELDGHPGVAARAWMCAAVSPFADWPGAPPEHLWPHIIPAADSALLIPRLWWEIQAAELAIPPEPAELMATVAELNAQRNAALVAQTLDVIALLNDAGVEPIVLKGVELLLSGRPKATSRMMNDIDIWVSDADGQTRAIDALTEAGFSTMKPLAEFRKTDSHHFPPFYRDDLPARIELHHRILRPSLPTLMDEARAAARATPFDPGNGLRAWRPDPMDGLAHAYIQATYMSTPDFEVARVPLMKWLDVADRVHALGVGPVASRQACGLTGPNTALDDQFLTAMQAYFRMPYSGRADTTYLDARDRLVRRSGLARLTRDVGVDLRKLHRAYKPKNLARIGPIVRTLVNRLRFPRGL